MIASLISLSSARSREALNLSARYRSISGPPRPMPGSPPRPPSPSCRAFRVKYTIRLPKRQTEILIALTRLRDPAHRGPLLFFPLYSPQGAYSPAPGHCAR